MTNLAIILGRTCRGRKAETMARWAHDKAHSRQDAEFELIDVAGFDLPLLDEELPPATGQLRTLHVKA